MCSSEVWNLCFYFLNFVIFNNYFILSEHFKLYSGLAILILIFIEKHATKPSYCARNVEPGASQVNLNFSNRAPAAIGASVEGLWIASISGDIYAFFNSECIIPWFDHHRLLGKHKKQVLKYPKSTDQYVFFIRLMYVA